MAVGSTSNLHTVDVTIVGGGPTGLFTGYLLHHLGVSVCIIDGKPQSLDLGRADALNARTQQYFEVAKILDDLLPLGIKCNTSSTFGDGEFKTRQDTWWVGLEHTLHKNFLMIGQPVVERILSERLEGLVRYGEQVVSISEHDEGVEVVTESGFKVLSRYAVGADGARSTVRKSMGVTFTGTKPEMLWAVLDTFIDTDFPVCPEIITFQLHGQSRVSWIPRERGLCRFYVLLEGEVTQERAEASIKEHLAPYRVDFTKTEWYSTFDVKERIASSFVSNNGSGRVILAGDAAHVHSVNANQGNLKDGAAETLIRSYDTERRTTAQGVIDVAAALVRDTVHTAKQYVGTIQKNAGYITGMGVSYRGMGSPLVKESEHRFWNAGDRCPDVVLQTSSNEATRLYHETTYGKFLVLSMGRRADVPLGHEDVAVVHSILPLNHSDKCSSPSGHEATRNGTRETTFMADWVTEEDPYTVVVRPDMYLGYVGKDIEGCKAYLDSLYI